MFKIVAVGGKLRGKEFELNKGDNTIGRSTECTIPVELDGVSKKHLQITVNGDKCFLEDLGSSNGTFVNGKLVKTKTLDDKDKIALPNVIFQLVYVKEKAVIIKKQVARIEEEDDVTEIAETMPKDLPGKLKFIFKHKFMSVLHGFNEQYEWNFMLGTLMVLMVAGIVGISVGPVMFSAENMVYKEIKARGEQYASEVARVNAIHLKRGDIQAIDTKFLDLLESKGVESYELYDMDGRIIRPSSKIDTYTQDVLSIRVKDAFKKTGAYDETFVDTKLDGDAVGIGKTLQVSTDRGNEPVAMIAIRFKPDSVRTLAIMKTTIYLKSFIYACMLAALFFGFIYYLTLKPINEIRVQAEEVMRGKRKELESKYVFAEIRTLRNSFNTVLQKNRELQSDDPSEFMEEEDDSSYVAILREIYNGTKEAAMVLNSERRVEYANEKCGDLTGIVESLIQGEDIVDCAGNEGFAGVLLKLCNDTASENGTSQQDYYELKGDDHIISVMSLIGKDNFAKAYYISFMRDN